MLLFLLELQQGSAESLSKAGLPTCPGTCQRPACPSQAHVGQRVPQLLATSQVNLFFPLNARPAWQGCTGGASYKGRSMIKQDVLPFLLKCTISLPSPRKSRVGRAHGPYLPVVFSYVCSWSSRTEKKGRNSLQPQFSPSQKGKTSFLSLWYTLHDFRTSSFDSSLNVKNMRLWGESILSRYFLYC